MSQFSLSFVKVEPACGAPMVRDVEGEYRVASSAEAGKGPAYGFPSTMDHLTGPSVVRLMRAHHKTIASLAAGMAVSQVRVRKVRAEGVQGTHFVRDWMEGITGDYNTGWDFVARVYSERRSSTRGA